MALTLGQFLAGLRQQESSGDYSAVNSIGATGAYQVMPANIGPWTKAALGHADTQEQFLASKADQDATAAYELGPIFQKYGPAGAASWWYSGDPTLAGSTKPQSGGPSIAEYVREVLGHANDAAAGGVDVSTAGSVQPTSGPGGSSWNPFPGGNWDPLNWVPNAAGGVVSDTAGAITSGAEGFAHSIWVTMVKVGLVIGGAALVVLAGKSAAEKHTGKTA